MALKEFDQLFASMDTFVRSLTSAAKLLEEAPALFLEELGRAFPPDHAEAAELVPRLAKELATCGARLHAGFKHVNTMGHLLAAARERSDAAHQVVSQRNKAWAPKERADQDADALRKRFGRSYSLQEKKGRLQAKSTADETFKKASSSAEEALDDVLSKRWITAAGVLSELCRCVSIVFGDGSLGRDCDSLAWQLEESREATAPDVRSTDTAARPPPPVTLEGAEVLPCASMPPPAAAGSLALPPQAPYSEGQRVEVWSSGEQAWVPGLVEKAFAEEGVDGADDGTRFKVPAGSVKVSHAKGFKYVRAEQVQTAVRPQEG